MNAQAPSSAGNHPAAAEDAPERHSQRTHVSSSLRFGQPSADHNEPVRDVAEPTEEKQNESVADEQDDDSEEVRLPLKKFSITEEYHITVLDHNNATLSVQPLKNFSDLSEEFPDFLNRGIARTRFVQPMPVQSVAIPLLLEDRDVIGLAPTGSGKTVAFAIPALATVQLNKRQANGVGLPAILVLAPTRELVQQTAKVFATLCGREVSVGQAYGGTDRDYQAGEIAHNGCNILVATPGRLCDFLNAGIVDLTRISFLVFDEADRMLQMGFAAQIHEIMEHIDRNRKRRTMMWSATWPESVEQLAATYLHPHRVFLKAGIGGRSVNTQITHNVYVVEDRLPHFVSLFKSGVIGERQKILLFVERKDGIEEFADSVRQTLSTQLNIPPRAISPLHGSMRQQKRDKILEKFREGTIRLLIATDVAARGLDIPDVEHVVNFDPPRNVDNYIHRVGRSARADKKGTAHTYLIRKSDWAQPNPAFPIELIQHLNSLEISVSPEVQRFAREFFRESANTRHTGRGTRHSGGFASRFPSRFPSRHNESRVIVNRRA